MVRQGLLTIVRPVRSSFFGFSVYLVWVKTLWIEAGADDICDGYWISFSRDHLHFLGRQAGIWKRRKGRSFIFMAKKACKVGKVACWFLSALCRIIDNGQDDLKEVRPLSIVSRMRGCMNSSPHFLELSGTGNSACKATNSDSQWVKWAAIEVGICLTRYLGLWLWVSLYFF